MAARDLPARAGAVQRQFVSRPGTATVRGRPAAVEVVGQLAGEQPRHVDRLLGQRPLDPVPVGRAERPDRDPGPVGLPSSSRPGPWPGWTRRSGCGRGPARAYRRPCWNWAGIRSDSSIPMNGADHRRSAIDDLRASATRSRGPSVDRSVSQPSPLPTASSARVRFSAIIWSIRSSIVPTQTNVWTCTLRRWPMRNARSVAWASVAGFHHRSTCTTWLAAVRFSPVPPALSDSSSTPRPGPRTGTGRPSRRARPWARRRAGTRPRAPSCAAQVRAQQRAEPRRTG